MQRFHLAQRDRRRHHMNLETALGHPSRSHGLDAEINRHHTESRFTVRPHDVGLGGAHLIGEMSAHHRRLSLDAFQQRGCAGFHTRDAHPHRPSLPDVARQGSGIDVTHPDDALGLKLRIEAPSGTPAGGIRAASRTT